jgi:hypothetical protein
MSLNRINMHLNLTTMPCYLLFICSIKTSLHFLFLFVSLHIISIPMVVCNDGYKFAWSTLDWVYSSPNIWSTMPPLQVGNPYFRSSLYKNVLINSLSYKCTSSFYPYVKKACIFFLDISTSQFICAQPWLSKIKFRCVHMV